MLTIAEAHQRLRIAAQEQQPLTETVAVQEALGRIVAEDILAEADLPGWDNSAMDGYAFCVEDAPSDFKDSHLKLPISQRIAAGQAPQPLLKGTAARIFTGAPIPTGADTVVMQEHCASDDTESMTIIKVPKLGANIRRRGQDVEQGAVLVTKGQRLRPQELGLCAAAGLAKITVYKPLKIAILVTGNELVEPGQPLQAGMIFDSNTTLLTSLLQRPCFEVVSQYRVADDLSDTEQSLESAAEQADVVITAGGASVGEEDYIGRAVKNRGQIDLWKVAIKPGKPLLMGHIFSNDKRIPIIGLPGNPMSLFVTLLTMVHPFLLRCAGQTVLPETGSSDIAHFSKTGESRDVFLRGKRGSQGVELHPNQSSGVLSSACWGDVLIHQPAGQDIVIGQTVTFYSYAELCQ